MQVPNTDLCSTALRDFLSQVYSSLSVKTGAGERQGEKEQQTHTHTHRADQAGVTKQIRNHNLVSNNTRFHQLSHQGGDC